MHSRVFEVSTKPIEESELCAESLYDHWFTNSIADYVDDIDEDLFDANYENLINFLGEGFDIDFDKKKIEVINKEAYFEKKYNHFMDTVEELQDLTLEQFQDDNFCSTIIHELTSNYEDKFGYYVYDLDDCNGVMTIDEYLRSIEDGMTIYLGTVIDYHF